MTIVLEVKPETRDQSNNDDAKQSKKLTLGFHHILEHTPVGFLPGCPH